MKLDDFSCMWRGKPIQTPTETQVEWLRPIDIRSAKKERAMLLLHGFSSSPAVFRELVPSLTHAYDAVIGFPLPGHAESFAAFAATRASDWVTSVELSCQQLLDDYTHVDVMGLSLGGVLACHLANQYPVHHLFLLAPAFDLRVRLAPALALVRALKRIGFQSIRNRGGNLHTQRAVEMTYRRIPLSAIIEILTLIQTFSFKAPNCPVDLFLGRYDEVVHSERVAKRFAGCHEAAIHWLEHSAHILPLDGDVDRLIACFTPS